MRRVPHELAAGPAPAVHPRAGRSSSLLLARAARRDLFLCQDTPHLVRLHSARVPSAPYMCFDEAYFKTLESMQWNRDNGCVELIPIVVGLP